MALRRIRLASFVLAGAGALLGLGACGGALLPSSPPSPDAGTAADASPDETSASDGGGASSDASDRDGGFDASLDAPTYDADAGSPLDPALACTPLPPSPALPPALVSAGTRLVPRRIAEPVAGGIEVPYDVFDLHFGVTCEPLRWDDGTIRCLPNVSRIIVAKRYADAALTMPITLEPLSSPPAAGTLAGSYGGFGQSFPCGEGLFFQLGRIGAQRASATYYDGVARSAPAGYGVFDVVPEPFDFVLMTEVRTQLAGGIALRELHGSDGSRVFPTALYDEAHDVPVDLRKDAPGGPRLLPPRATQLGYHFAPPPSGAATPAWCSAPDPMFAYAGCEPSATSAPRFVTSDLLATFGVVMQTGTIHYCSSGGDLDGPPQPIVPLSTVASVLTPCASIPLTEWTPATTMTLGAGRLTRDVAAIGGVPFAPPATFMPFHDATLGDDCLPRTAADGALRCLPLHSATVAYSDAACTDRIVAYTIPGAPAFAFQGSDAPDGFPGARGAITVFEVGAALPAGTPFYYRSGAGCYAGFGSHLFALGAEVPLSTFASFELRDAPP